VLLAVVILSMILVFGGVVLVWSYLIDFLKEIIVRYPEVKEEIIENKVLEQVIIRYGLGLGLCPIWLAFLFGLQVGLGLLLSVVIENKTLSKL
jgi:hypothetical protein